MMIRCILLLASILFSAPAFWTQKSIGSNPVAPFTLARLDTTIAPQINDTADSVRAYARALISDSLTANARGWINSATARSIVSDSMRVERAFDTVTARAVTHDTSLALRTLISAREPALGNPSQSGQVLSSTTGGVRSWISVVDSARARAIIHDTSVAIRAATQPLDADLTAIAALTGTGYAKRTATTPTWAVSATIPASDVTGLPTSLPPSGTAGGDLSGTYPNPTVYRINGVSLASLGTTIIANTTGTGVPRNATFSDIQTVVGTQGAALAYMGPASGPNANPTFRSILNTDLASVTWGGALAGTGPNPDVRKIWGVSVPTPTAGNLYYNGAAYVWDATEYVTRGSVPLSATLIGTNSSRQFIDQSSATLSNNTTGSAARLTTSRTIQIGSQALNFDGSSGLVYTLANMGVAASHSVASNIVLKSNGNNGFSATTATDDGTTFATTARLGWGGGVLRDLFGDATYTALYGSGVTPSSSPHNYGLAIAKNGQYGFVGGTVQSGLAVGGAPIVVASSGGASLAGTTTLSGLAGSTTRVATINAAGQVGATSWAYDGPWLPLAGGTVSGYTNFTNDIGTQRQFVGNGDIFVRAGAVLLRTGDGNDWANAAVQFPSTSTVQSFRVDGGAQFNSAVQFTAGAVHGASKQIATHLYSVSSTLPALAQGEWCWVVMDQSSGGPTYWATPSTRSLRYYEGGTTTTLVPTSTQMVVPNNGTAWILYGPAYSGSTQMTMVM